MKRYRAIIVDDEKPVIQLMKHIIAKNGRYDIEGTYANSLEVAEAVAALLPDVAFLDIEMPKLSGLELARLIAELSPRTRIVFSTAYRQYALDAFDVNAVDYILKPVTPAAIQRVTGRLDELFGAPSAGARKAGREGDIRCFGAFEVRNAAGELLRWRTRKTEELFAYFLCHPNREIVKWKLADALWPDMDEDRAMNNMYNSVYRLKKTLKEHGLGIDVLKTQDGYSLDTGGMEYDVALFGAGDPNSAAAGLSHEQQLCKAYRGRLLETKDYGWKLPLEEAFARQYSAAVRELAKLHLKAGEWKLVEERLLAGLAIEPLNEEMNNMLVSAYELAGHPEKALRQASEFAVAYKEEFGVEPGASNATRRV
ncbi:response regulator [Cohnella suwonensis]|uniref:Response regulator n=1 Tax=Cohnella suwonensis TaxID=696072 RepID=A0ABW0LQ48_9BACL